MGISIYAARVNGARTVSFDAGDDVRVLVEPGSEDGNARAQTLAAELSDVAQTRELASAAELAAKVEVDAVREQLFKARAQIQRLEAINAAAIAGRWRFFGPVLMKPAKPGDWTGEVWLLDPVKQECGQALCFASVAEVRALHPELWVICTTVDGVLLDAWRHRPEFETKGGR